MHTFMYTLKPNTAGKRLQHGNRFSVDARIIAVGTASTGTVIEVSYVHMITVPESEVTSAHAKCHTALHESRLLHESLSQRTSITN